MQETFVTDRLKQLVEYASTHTDYEYRKSVGMYTISIRQISCGDIGIHIRIGQLSMSVYMKDASEIKYRDIVTTLYSNESDGILNIPNEILEVLL